jgi:3-oxoacyl-[acyl-carrier protein] reductase
MTKHNEKVAFITGADRGIGEGIAKRLKQEGVKLYLCSDNLVGLEQSIKNYAPNSEDVITAGFDIRDNKKVKEAVAEAINKFGKVDYLLNVAGISYYGGLLQHAEEEWEKTLRTNVDGYYATARAVTPNMINNKSGIIINVSSIWGQRPAPVMMSYSVSKFAVEGLTKCLAEELKPHGIKVSSIVLDKVDTAFRDNMKPYIDYNEEQRNRMISVADVVDTMMYILNSSARVSPSSITLEACLWQQ